MLATELLFQFSHKADLDLLKSSQLWHRHKDDDRLFSLHIYLLGSSYEEFSQLCLHVTVHLQIQEGLKQKCMLSLTDESGDKQLHTI